MQDVMEEKGFLSRSAAIQHGQRLASAEGVRPGEECLSERNTSFAISQ